MIQVIIDLDKNTNLLMGGIFLQNILSKDRQDCIYTVVLLDGVPTEKNAASRKVLSPEIT